MQHRISQVDGINDLDDEIIEENYLVTLELDAMENIVGLKLAPNLVPPGKVYHPMAGLGIVEDEPSITSDGETFINYFFPDDPKTFIVTHGPNRGKREKSIYNVFLKE